MSTTKFVSKEDAILNRKWLLVDAAGVSLGRVASEVAALIRGKHKACFATHTDVGDFVIVINADKVALTGNKKVGKLYHHHSNYPGGLKTTTAGKILAEKPTRLIEYAVKGMLPKGKLGHSMHTKLKVYEGAEHPHAAQQPSVYELKSAK